jgi:hypothetical protein
MVAGLDVYPGDASALALGPIGMSPRALIAPVMATVAAISPATGVITETSGRSSSGFDVSGLRRGRGRRYLRPAATPTAPPMTQGPPIEA